MQAKVDSKVAPSLEYQDYVPNTEIVEEKDCETLLIYLPGFKKDQLKVQITRTPTLKISGERPIGDNKWSRFRKEFPISKNCDTEKITAKFDSGILCIRHPKKDEEKIVNEAQSPQKTEEKNASNKMEDGDKIDSKDGDVAQKSRENFMKGGLNLVTKMGTVMSVVFVFLVIIIIGIYFKNLIMWMKDNEN